jgi:hypothetical protein
MCKRGEICIDKEQDSKVIIVQLISERCDEVVCKEGQYGSQTVFDFNSRYSYVSRDDPVVVAVYKKPVQQMIYRRDNFKQIEELTREGRGRLAQEAIEKSHMKQYYFPITRIIEK